MQDPSLPGLSGDSTLDQKLAKSLEGKPSSYQARTHHKNEEGKPKFTNRLIEEQSPYLLQHAHNPVNWFPWGDEAFERAEKLNRPVLLSIGYSTCHWCHVMERESFEDIEIATYINQHFVAIKVDREERPDVDSVYMDILHMMRGRGGWPLTMVLTHERQAFFGGTYFPPRDGARGRRRGFLSILKEVHQTYQDKPADLIERARELSQKLNQQAQAMQPGSIPEWETLDRVAGQLRRNFDERWGGFGAAPKFPRPSNFDLLLRWARRTPHSDQRNWGHKAVFTTLDRMIEGGVHDHVGGGFHRYSTDQKWLVPHFEKMLYDNAQLVMAFLDAYQSTDSAAAKRRYSEAALDTLRYMDQDLSHPDGGFFSATDADSLNPKTGHQDEGWYFTWTPAELEQVLGEENAKLVESHLGVIPGGNFEGRNILHLPSRMKLDEVSAWEKDAMMVERWPQIREQLAQARSKRPAPLRDEKVLSSWNGLVLSAFARAALLLNDQASRTRALKLAAFIERELVQENRRMLRMWVDAPTGSKARGVAVLDDYAFVIQGMLDLYEAVGDPKWIKLAIELQRVLNERYLDPKSGGYFISPDDGEALLVRQKPGYDGAEPAGNSVAALNLLRLHQFTGSEDHRQKAQQLFSAFAKKLNRTPFALPKMLSALDFSHDRAQQIFILLPDVDEREVQQAKEELLDVLRQSYLPNRVLAVLRDREVEEHAKIIPALQGKRSKGGKTTVYLCEEGLCQQPTSDAAEFAKQLKSVQEAARVVEPVEENN